MHNVNIEARETETPGLAVIETTCDCGASAAVLVHKRDHRYGGGVAFIGVPPCRATDALFDWLRRQCEQ